MRISRSPVLPREVRCRFFQEGIFHFEVPDPAFQFLYPLGVRHAGGQRVPGDFLPVGRDPASERRFVYIKFPRDLCDLERAFHYFPGGLHLKFRSVVLPPRHFPPSFPARILLDPLSGNGGAPHSPERGTAGRPTCRAQRSASRTSPAVAQATIPAGLIPA